MNHYKTLPEAQAFGSKHHLPVFKADWRGTANKGAEPDFMDGIHFVVPDPHEIEECRKSPEYTEIDGIFELDGQSRIVDTEDNQQRLSERGFNSEDLFSDYDGDQLVWCPTEDEAYHLIYREGKVLAIWGQQPFDPDHR
jgi:hypothetical protein